ncbi:hypothetical protein BH11PAT2_BH11PAT2_03600 [soil metagenome]
MNQEENLTPLQKKHIEELWVDALNIESAENLYQESGHILPVPAARATREALTYFAKPLTRDDGTRDGRLAWNKDKLGFGRILTLDQPITVVYKTPGGQERSLLVALQRKLSSPEFQTKDIKSIDCVHQRRDYGIESPNELAALFVYYIGLRKRGYNHRPPLPDTLR